MIKHFFILIITMMSLQGSSQETIKKTLQVDGIERSYIIYIPANYQDKDNVPLLFNFHGYGMSSTAQLSYCDFRPIADTAGFVLVVPQGTLLKGKTHWKVGGWTIESTADDIGFTNAMIDSITANFKIDKKRIYSTGFSNGGFFSFELACQLSNKIAAIGSVSGSMTPETLGSCKPTRAMPVIQIHGLADSLVFYNGTAWSKPVENALSYWTNYNHTQNSPNITDLPDIVSNDGSTVKKICYKTGESCSEVEHLQVVGGDHTWPGASGRTNNKDINASLEIWNFLRNYTLDGCAKG